VVAGFQVSISGRFWVSTEAREVKGELKIVGQLGKDDLDRLRKALNGQLAMIEAPLED